MLNQIFVRLSHRLLLVNAFEKTLIRVIALAAPGLALIALLVDYLKYSRMAEGVWSVSLNLYYFQARFRIAFALIGAGICIWPIKAKRALLALVLLIWVAGEYLLWLRNSLAVGRYYKQLGVDNWPEESAAHLFGATWWDISTIVLSVMLLCWLLWITISALSSSAEQGPMFSERGTTQKGYFS